MPATAKYGLRYPSLGDPPNGPLAFQNLATDVDALGDLGGKRRTADSATITTTETVVIDTPVFALAASSVFLIEFYSRLDTLVGGVDARMRIRDTGLGGTIRGEVGVGNILYTNHGILRVLYKTTTAELKAFAGTLIREAGTGTITAKVPTHLIVSRRGPSTLMGDF